MISQIRLRLLAERLPKLGPRCLYEYLADAYDQPAGSFEERLERFANINPDHLSAVGGTKFPPRFVVLPKDSDHGAH